MTEEQRKNVEQLNTYDRKIKQLAEQQKKLVTKRDNLYARVILGVVRKYDWPVEQFLDIAEDSGRRFVEGRFVHNKSNANTHGEMPQN